MVPHSAQDFKKKKQQSEADTAMARPSRIMYKGTIGEKRSMEKEVPDTEPQKLNKTITYQFPTKFSPIFIGLN